MSIQAKAQAHVPAAYSHPGIVMRRKGQRYDQRILPFPASIKPGTDDVLGEHDELIGKAKILPNTCTRRDPMSGWFFEAQCIEVTLTNGTVIPCTRLCSDKGENYVLCQNLSFKSFQPK
jgi:hypothetical protein